MGSRGRVTISFWGSGRKTFSPAPQNPRRLFLLSSFLLPRTALPVDCVAESIMPKVSSNIRSFLGHALAESPARARVLTEGVKEAVPTRLSRMASRPVGVACGVLLLILMSSLWCYSADVVLIRSTGGGPSSEQHELELRQRQPNSTIRMTSILKE